MSLEKIDLTTLASGQFCWSQEFCPFKFNLPCENLVGVYVADDHSITESISFTTSNGEHRVQNWADRRGSACRDGFGTLAQTTSEYAPFFKSKAQGGKGIRFDGKSWLTGQLKNNFTSGDSFTLVFTGAESPEAGADKSSRPVFSFRSDDANDVEILTNPLGVATSDKSKTVTSHTMDFTPSENSTSTTYAVVMSASSTAYYRNGNLLGTEARTAFPTKPGLLDFGCRLALNVKTPSGNSIEAHEDTKSLGDCFKGTLYGFAAYNSTLTVDQINKVGRVLANEESLVLRAQCEELPPPLHGFLEKVPNKYGEVDREGSSVVFRCEGHGADGSITVASNSTANDGGKVYEWQASTFQQFTTCDKFGRWSGYQSGVVPACVEKEMLDVLEGRKPFVDDDQLSWDALEDLANSLKDQGFGNNLTGDAIINIPFPEDLEGRFWYEIQYYLNGVYHKYGYLIMADGSIRFLTAEEAALFEQQRIQMDKAQDTQENNQNNGQNADGSPITGGGSNNNNGGSGSGSVGGGSGSGSGNLPSDYGPCFGRPGLLADCSTGIPDIDNYPRDPTTGLPTDTNGRPIIPVPTDPPHKDEVIKKPDGFWVEVPIYPPPTQYFDPNEVDTGRVEEILDGWKGHPLEGVMPGDIIYEWNGVHYPNGVYVDKDGVPYFLTKEDKERMDALEQALKDLIYDQLNKDKETGKNPPSIITDIVENIKDNYLPPHLGGYLPDDVFHEKDGVEYPNGAVQNPETGEIIILTPEEEKQFENLDDAIQDIIEEIIKNTDLGTGSLPVGEDGKVVYPDPDEIRDQINDWIGEQTGTSTTTTTRPPGGIRPPTDDTASLGGGRGYGLDDNDLTPLIGFARGPDGKLIPVTEAMFATGKYDLIDLPAVYSNGCAAVRKLNTVGDYENRMRACNGETTFTGGVSDGVFSVLNIQSVQQLGLPDVRLYTQVIAVICPDSCALSTPGQDKWEEEQKKEQEKEAAEEEKALEEEAAPWGTDEDGHVVGPDGKPILIDGKPVTVDEMKDIIRENDKLREEKLESGNNLIDDYLDQAKDILKLPQYFSYNGTHYQRGNLKAVDITPFMPKHFTVSTTFVQLRMGGMGPAPVVYYYDQKIKPSLVLHVLNSQVDKEIFGPYGYVGRSYAMVGHKETLIVYADTGLQVPQEDLDAVFVQNPELVPAADAAWKWAMTLTMKHLNQLDTVRFFNESVELINLENKLSAADALIKDALEQQQLSDKEAIENGGTDLDADWSHFESEGDSEDEPPFIPAPNEQCYMPPHLYIGPGFRTKSGSHGQDKYVSEDSYTAVLVCDTENSYYPMGANQEAVTCSNAKWQRPTTLKCAKACKPWDNTTVFKNGGLVASPLPSSNMPGSAAQVRCGVGFVAKEAIASLRRQEQPSSSSYEDVATCKANKWTTDRLKCYGIGRLSVGSNHGSVLQSSPDALVVPTKSGSRASDPQSLTVTMSNEVKSSRFYKFLKSGMSLADYSALHAVVPEYPITFYSSGAKLSIHVPEAVDFGREALLKASLPTTTNDTTVKTIADSQTKKTAAASFLQTQQRVFASKDATVAASPSAATVLANVTSSVDAETEVIVAASLTPDGRLSNGTYLDYKVPREFNVTQFSREARSFDHIKNVFDVGCNVNIANALALSERTRHTLDMHTSPFAVLTDCFRGYVSQVAIWRRELTPAEVAQWNHVSRKFMTLAFTKDISQEFVEEQIAGSLRNALSGLFIANDAFMDFSDAYAKVNSNTNDRAVMRWRNALPKPAFNITDPATTAEQREAVVHWIPSLEQTKLQSFPIYSDGVGVFFDGKDDYLVSSVGFAPYSYTAGFTVNVQVSTTRAFGMPQAIVSFPTPNIAAASLAATKKEFACTTLGPDFVLGVDLTERESENISQCAWRQQNYLTSANLVKPAVVQSIMNTAQQQAKLQAEAAAKYATTITPKSETEAAAVAFIQMRAFKAEKKAAKAVADKKDKKVKSNNINEKAKAKAAAKEEKAKAKEQARVDGFKAQREGKNPMLAALAQNGMPDLGTLPPEMQGMLSQMMGTDPKFKASMDALTQQQQVAIEANADADDTAMAMVQKTIVTEDGVTKVVGEFPQTVEEFNNVKIEYNGSPTGMTIDPNVPLHERPGYKAAKYYLETMTPAAKQRYAAQIEYVTRIYENLPPGVDVDLDEILSYMTIDEVQRVESERLAKEQAADTELQRKMAKVQESNEKARIAVEKRLAEEAEEKRQNEAYLKQLEASTFLQVAPEDSPYADLLKKHEAYRMRHMRMSPGEIKALFRPNDKAALQRAKLLGVTIPEKAAPTSEKKKTGFFAPDPSTEASESAAAAPAAAAPVAEKQ